MSHVRDLFDDWARAGRAEGMEKGHGPAARLAFDLLHLGKQAQYLDIGCGNGYTVRWASQCVSHGHALGLDVSEEMIRIAREMSPAASNIQYIVGGFPDVDLGEARFDAIFSMEVFYYLPDMPAALDRVRELLRPGGSFACVVDYYGENAASHSWPDDLGVPMILLDSAGWADTFYRAGLAVVDQRRLRLPADQANASWKVSEGSLLTMGRR